MDDTDHTPTPWVYDPDCDYEIHEKTDVVPTFRGLDWDKEFGVVGSSEHLFLKKADAEFIILACNSHATLLQACQQARDAMMELCEHSAFADTAPEFNEGGVGYEASESLKAALLAAKEPQPCSAGQQSGPYSYGSNGDPTMAPDNEIAVVLNSDEIDIILHALRCYGGHNGPDSLEEDIILIRAKMIDNARQLPPPKDP